MRRTALWLCVLLLWLGVLLLGIAPPSGAERDPSALPHHALLQRARLEGRTPVLRLERRALRATENRGEKFRVDHVPLDPFHDVDLELERFRVTHPHTRFVVGRKGAPDEPLDFDPEEVALYRGRVIGRPGSRVVLALRDGRHTGSIDLGPGEARYWISSRREAGHPRLAADEAIVFQAQGAPDLPPDVPLCGVDGDAVPDPITRSLEQVAQAAMPGPAVGQSHVQLAVETDYEFFRLFADLEDTAAYVVALYGQVSDIYLRDTDAWVELVYVRLWDTPDDLFNEVDPSPLGEFQSVWNSTMGGVQRDVAQLISGRRDYPFGGQAYLSAMCGSSGYGVVGYMQGSFPDPAKPSPYNYDISVTAHELGHNAGTGHTHDSPNFVDSCDDPLTTPQRGTIMSYCSQTWSGGNTNRDLYFHSIIQQNIEGHLGGSSCIVDDCNLNGVADGLDLSGATSSDANGNGVPDECEDCNDNGVLDPADIGVVSSDFDGDGVPDECQPDCNGNGIPDEHDITLGTSTDAYGNDVPDECEADCNSNGTSDYTEIQLDMTLDIDRNRVLDACQDCDTDGTPDLDELAGAHDLWLASGLAAEPLRRFYASTGVRSVTSSGPGVEEGQDLLVTDDLRVLVSSADDDRVAEFDVAGSYVGDLVASGAGGLDHPAGLAISPQGRLLVASHGTDEVLAYAIDTGAFLGAFVSAGSGGLVGPFGLAYGPNGNLYVTSEVGGVIEYDGLSGELLGTFVDPLDNGGLATPKGLVFKPDGNLLVASYGTNQTLEFRRETGFPIGPWAKSGNSERLNQESPWGLRIGPNGNVFIVRTGEAFGSEGGGGEHEHAALHLTNAQIYEYDVRSGDFLRAHINGNDHGMEFPTGFDFVPGWDVDCNRNELPDSCDIAQGGETDADSNGIPDSCQLDCNGNGKRDRLEIIPFGPSTDCNANLVPDECDLAAGVAGPCETVSETACADGFDNDRDGLRDCADPDCDPTGACLGGLLFGETFESGPGAFGYVDDAFRATSAPAYASGAVASTAGFEGDAAVTVSLGGVDDADILGMSGGWQRSFALTEAEDVILTLRYRLDQTHGYENDEFSQVLVSVDGTLVGTGGNDYVVQITGDGQGGVGQPRTTGWQELALDLGTLAAGSHSLVVGGYNNKKTLADEETTMALDSVAVHTVAPFVCGDHMVSPGEQCDDGNQLNGDCCDAACQFEPEGTVCDDGAVCSETDRCDDAGGCSGDLIQCPMPPPCSVGYCDEVLGCVIEPLPTASCSDVIPALPPWGRLALAASLAAIGAATVLSRRRTPGG